MSCLKLSRRALLRGSGGIAIALPLLDSMLNDRGWLHGTARAASTPPPVRLLTFFWLYGAQMEEFTPTRAGTDYTLPRCLEPLQARKADFNVLTGLVNLAATKGVGTEHQKGKTCFSTGAPSPSGQSSGGPSLEQFAGKNLGKTTKFPALVVSPNVGTDGNAAHVSWADAGQPVPPERRPAALFTKLFAGGTDPSMTGTQQTAMLADARRRKRSVLDFVTADAKRLKSRLGASDNRRLDKHLEAVLDIERRLQLDEQAPMSGGACAKPAAPPADPASDDPWFYENFGGPVERYRLLVDLTVAALRCDLTRFASVRCEVTVGDWVHATYAGETRDHHTISHDGGAKELHVAYTRYQMGFLAELMDKLAAVKEGDRTLLQNSLVYASSDVSDGGAHNCSNMPVILAGNGGGTITTGRHVNYLPFLTPGKWDQVPLDTWTDNGRLFLTMLRTAGMTNLASFGIANKPIDLS